MDVINESPRSYWVIEGKLAAGAHPGSKRIFPLTPSLVELVEAGFDSFVDLTQPDERGPDHYQQRLMGPDRKDNHAVHYRRFAIPDMSVPDIEQMAAVLDYLDAEINDGRQAFLHCQAGLGRTGTVVGCFLSRTGVDSQELLEVLSSMRRKSGALGSSPETEGQRRFVQTWPTVDPARVQ